MIRQIISLDQRLIGISLTRNAPRAVLATAVGLLALAIDFGIIWRI